MRRKSAILLFTILSICSMRLFAQEQIAPEVSPPTIKVQGPEEVTVGRPFYLEIIASWQAGPGYQLTTEVTVPEGLVRGKVSADSQSFGKNAGQLVYRMEFTAKEPAEYVFGDLAVRYWLAGHQDKAEYQRLQVIEIKAVVPTYLGMTLPCLLGFIAAIVILTLLIYFIIVTQKKKKMAKLNKVDPAVEEYQLLTKIELSVAGGEAVSALAALADLANKQDDQKQEKEYRSKYERAAYGGGQPSLSDLKYFLHQAQLTFEKRYPEFKPGQKEEDNE